MLFSSFFYLAILNDIQRKEPRVFSYTGLHHLKEGGYLLSRIALQYHRRKWA